MHSRHQEKGRDRLWFGFVLVAVGTLLLLDRFGVINVENGYAWWGLIPVALGITRIASWGSARGVASGVSMTLFGAWFLISANEWYGLDWGTSWPMVFVAIGASMVVRAVLEPVFAKRDAGSTVGGGAHHV